MKLKMTPQYATWIDLVEAMSKTTTSDPKDLVSLVILDEQKKSVPAEVMRQPMFQITKQRAARAGLDMSDPAILFFAMLSGNPGDIVVYVHYMRGVLLKHDWSNVVDMKGVCNIFPLGFLSPSQMDAVWTAQKTEHGQNLLDGVLLLPATVVVTA